MDYAKRDFRRSLSADVMAGMVNVSTSHLAHLFKREANVSLNHFVRKLRLQHAKRLLESSFLSVKQVMVSSGFNDASHFVRDFKQEYGKTPSEHRKNHQDSVSANE
jgi:transcriptional regulator GlxA family with amidase domain